MKETVRMLERSSVDAKVDAPVERLAHGKDAGFLADVLEAVDDGRHVQRLLRAEGRVGRVDHQIIAGSAPNRRVWRLPGRDVLEGFAEQGALAAARHAGAARGSAGRCSCDGGLTYA